MAFFTQERRRSWAILALRVVIGLGFMVQGIAKWSHGPANFGKLLQQIGAPLPTQTAWLVTLLETFGGLAILLGFAVTILSVPLIASMLVALFTVQIHYGFSSVNTIGLKPSGPVFGPPGYEINLLYIAGLLVIALAGPGAASVDDWFKTRKGGKAAARRRHGQ